VAAGRKVGKLGRAAVELAVRELDGSVSGSSSSVVQRQKRRTN
jgi:hypothetical protein